MRPIFFYLGMLTHLFVKVFRLAGEKEEIFRSSNQDACHLLHCQITQRKKHPVKFLAPQQANLVES